MTQKKYNVISLFSGGMGLDLGLEQTGRFKVVACVERDYACCETIRANRDAGRLDRRLVVFEDDVSQISPDELLAAVGLKAGEVDLLVGGPPCQSFSTAGKRAAVKDVRGTLLWQYLRFIEAIRPRFFVMENVRGLLSAALNHRPIAERPDQGGSSLKPSEERGTVIRRFVRDLQEIHRGEYHMDCFEVNAVNYGAPQLRERAIFIGNRFNAEVQFPDPTHGAPNTANSRQATLFTEDALQPWATFGDAVKNLQDEQPILMDFSPRKKNFLAMVPPGSNWRSLPVEVQQESMGKAWFAKGGRSGWWRRLSYDLPCPTLVTMPNHASTALCHPEEARALTLKEYARVQEFPDDWEFCGKTSEKYAQVGNAVPVRLGATTGQVVAAELDRLRKRQWVPYSAKPESCRIVYVQSHVRTRQWFKNGETLVWQTDQQHNPTYAAPKLKKQTKQI